MARGEECAYSHYKSACGTFVYSCHAGIPYSKLQAHEKRSRKDPPPAKSQEEIKASGKKGLISNGTFAKLFDVNRATVRVIVRTAMRNLLTELLTTANSLSLAASHKQAESGEIRTALMG